MSEENYGLSANPMFGAMIGQQIANNKLSDMNARHAAELSDALTKSGGVAVEQGNAAMGIAVAAVTLKQELEALKQEVIELESWEMGLTATIKGVRAVTRELMSELRKSDPNNPLLEKKVRDKIFDNGYESNPERYQSNQWRKRKEEAPLYRDDAYGAKGSNKGGPEKSQITSNASVRAEAAVPEHVNDRERFMGLIKELHNTLAAKDPNAPILKSQTMFDVFTEYALNEMDRQPAAGSKNGV